ncbi:MAG: BrnT family toxin [Deltaproteobacteria bacterium]|nr:BrnT family toxin [Deltaproteobacteria bacterium]
MRFEWDPAKARRNEMKHGVRFSEAATVFGDPLAATAVDPVRSAREARFLTIGHARSGRLLIVAHVDRNGSVRLISARSVTPRERKAYEEDT